MRTLARCRTARLGEDAAQGWRSALPVLRQRLDLGETSRGVSCNPLGTARHRQDAPAQQSRLGLGLRTTPSPLPRLFGHAHTHSQGMCSLELRQRAQATPRTRPGLGRPLDGILDVVTGQVCGLSAVDSVRKPDVHGRVSAGCAASEQSCQAPLSASPWHIYDRRRTLGRGSDLAAQLREERRPLLVHISLAVSLRAPQHARQTTPPSSDTAAEPAQR